MGVAWGAIGTAAAGLIGDMMSQSGQRDANALNQQEILQEEGWETQMSNTAVQRRMQDLKAAGVNPMLAAGDPASTPGIGTLSMQNPNAAFGNLGSQAASAVGVAQQGTAVSAGATKDLASAQQASAAAHLADVQATKASGVDTDSASQSIAESKTRQVLMDAQGQAALAQSQLSESQVRVADATLPKIQAEIAAIGAAASKDQAQTHLANLQSVMQGLNNAQFQYLSPSVIQSAQNAATKSRYDLNSLELSFPQQRADSSMWQANPGLSYVNAVMNWFHLGANIGGK